MEVRAAASTADVRATTAATVVRAAAADDSAPQRQAEVMELPQFESSMKGMRREGVDPRWAGSWAITSSSLSSTS